MINSNLKPITFKTSERGINSMICSKYIKNLLFYYGRKYNFDFTYVYEWPSVHIEIEKDNIKTERKILYLEIERMFNMYGLEGIKVIIKNVLDVFLNVYDYEINELNLNSL